MSTKGLVMMRQVERPFDAAYPAQATVTVLRPDGVKGSYIVVRCAEVDPKNADGWRPPPYEFVFVVRRVA